MTARTAFFGTPSAAIPSLAALRSISMVELVVTRPDRPRGRSGTPQPPAIKEAAAGWDLTVAQPNRAQEVIGLLAGIDLAVVVAYGQLLPADMLSATRCGFVNVHFSRLPRWRGAAPVARAVLAGDAATGVDIIQLDAGMDTGPLMARAAVDIDPTDTAGTLTDRLARMGGALLEETVPSILDGTIELTPQPADGVSHAAKVTSVEAHLDPRAMSAEACDRMVRAFNPKPGAWGVVDGDRLKVWKATPRREATGPPGKIVVGDGHPVLKTADGDLELVEVQQAGKGRMAGDVWARGQRGALCWE